MNKVEDKSHFTPAKEVCSNNVSIFVNSFKEIKYLLNHSSGDLNFLELEWFATVSEKKVLIPRIKQQSKLPFKTHFAY